MAISRREKEKEERKKAILDAAESHFLARGFKETRIEEIMSASQFSKRTIYQYFGSKEEILVAVTIRKAEELFALYREAAARESAAYEKIRAVMKTFIGFFARQPAWYRLMTFTGNLEPFDDRNGSLPRLGRMKFASIDFFEGILDEAKKKKSAPPELNARMSAQYLMVAGMGILHVTLGIDEGYWEYARIDKGSFLDFSIDKVVDSLSLQ